MMFDGDLDAEHEALFPPLPPPLVPLQDQRIADAVERNWRLLQERRLADQRAEVSARNATIARDIAHAFTEYERALRKVAETKGSAVDHCVTVDLADYCAARIAHYQRLEVGYRAAASEGR